MPILNTAKITKEEIKQAPTTDLVDTYNHITGKEIKKFESRSTAESRLWKLIETLPPGEDVSKEAPVKKVATAAEPAAKKAFKKREVFESRTIKILVSENPKRKDSRAHKKFEVLMSCDGKTIKELKEKEGRFPTLDGEAGWPATELRWSLKLNLVKLEA
jgi:hypothetical protein